MQARNTSQHQESKESAAAEHLAAGLKILKKLPYQGAEFVKLKKILSENPNEAHLIAKGIKILHHSGFAYPVILKLAGDDPQNKYNYSIYSVAKTIAAHMQLIQGKLLGAKDGYMQMLKNHIDQSTETLSFRFRHVPPKKRPVSDVTMAEDHKTSAVASVRSHSVFSAVREVSGGVMQKPDLEMTSSSYKR